MQAQINVHNTGKRVIIARARFGHESNQVVDVKLPPGDSVQTLSFNMGDAHDAAKFKALAKLLTDVKGPLGHAIKGKKAVLDVTVVGGEPAASFAPPLPPKPKAEASDSKQGASKAKGG